MDINLATATRDVRIHYCLELFPFVILGYDHILTLPREVTAIWRRPITLNTALYLANRYLATIGSAVFLGVGFLTLSDKVCQTASLGGQLLLFANQTMICLLLLIRVYAIYARDRRILVTFFCLGAVMIGVSSFSFVDQKSQPLTGFPGCILEHTSENAIRLVIPWECMLLYDALVLGLTVRRTYRTTHRDHAAIRLPNSGRSPSYIQTLILRDGALYFAGMTLSNALNILCFYVTPPILKGSLSRFNSVIGVTLVSRMVLNLRTVTTEVHEPAQSHPSWDINSEMLSQPRFGEPDFKNLGSMELSMMGKMAHAELGVNFADEPVLDITHHRGSTDVEYW